MVELTLGMDEQRSRRWTRPNRMSLDRGMGSDLYDFHDDGINDAGGTTVQLQEYTFPPAPVPQKL